MPFEEPVAYMTWEIRASNMLQSKLFWICALHFLFPMLLFNIPLVSQKRCFPQIERGMKSLTRSPKRMCLKNAVVRGVNFGARRTLVHVLESESYGPHL